MVGGSGGRVVENHGVESNRAALFAVVCAAGWRRYLGAMKTRLAGIGLVLLGILFAVLFVYQPLRDGPAGFMGFGRTKGIVFIPLAVLTGLSFIIGGPTALEAFQAKPKSRGQLAFVLGIIIASGIMTGLGYWQLKSRWLREQEPVILDAAPRVPIPPPPRPVQQ